MQVRKLAVEGALEFTPASFPDHRGKFVSPFQEPAFVAATGSRLFRVAQTSFSESRRGVVRGVHFATTPPGTAKYTCCVRGRAIDVVVDVRVGSPTYGQWDSALLDRESFRAMYLPVGVGHAFIALEEATVMAYLLSESYVPGLELAINPLDPALGLPVPRQLTPVLSERDRAAPTLAEAAEAGILPEYAACREREREVLPRAEATPTASVAASPRIPGRAEENPQ